MSKPFDPETPPEEGWIPPCPPSGTGCHGWLYRAVNALVSGGWPDEAIDAWVNRWMSRPPQPAEVQNTLRKVKVELNNPSEEQYSIPKPPLNEILIKQFGAAGDTPIEEVMAGSPIPVENISTGDFLREIYAPDESTIIFTDERSQGQLVWNHSTTDSAVEAITAQNASGAFMLLNPVTGEFQHVERLGKKSRRSEETLTKYKYCLIEADNTPVEKWLTIIKQIPLPIKSITLSGNQSAHSIIQLDSKDKKEWQTVVSDLASMMVPLGACPGSLTAVRLTRLAGVKRRDTQKTQKLIYLNPDPKWEPLPLLASLR